MRSLPPTCSTRKAANILNVAPSTVQIWVETGCLEAWKTPGGHRRITLASIDRLLEKGMGGKAFEADSGTDKSTDTASKLRMLVVEDEEALLLIYQGYINSWGLPVSLTLADNGYNALLRVGFDHPHLIITDLNMPDMDGFRMIEALHRDEQTTKITVVAVTGLSDGEIAEQGGLPKDVMVLHKPLDFSRLQKIVEDALARLGLTGSTPQ
jgi:excisionase family DNA binding protein